MTKRHSPSTGTQMPHTGTAGLQLLVSQCQMNMGTQLQRQPARSLIAAWRPCYGDNPAAATTCVLPGPERGRSRGGAEDARTLAINVRRAAPPAPHSTLRSVGQRLRHRPANPDHIVTLSDESVREDAR
jgi:hypothetical protein